MRNSFQLWQFWHLWQSWQFCGLSAECLRRQLLQSRRLKHSEKRAFDADKLLALKLPQYAGDCFTGCSGHARNLLVGQNHVVARSDLSLAHLPPVEQQIRE